MHSKRQLALRKRGFSLIELLSVIAILSLLVTAVVPAVNDFMASSRRTKYLSDLSSLLESARQYAVSHNTYVWVAFNSPAADSKTPLCARLFATRDGLSHNFGDQEAWPSNIVADTNYYTPISRVITLGDFTLTAANTPFSSTPIFTVTKGNNGDDATRCIQFTPVGEAKVGPGIEGSIVFTTKASYGKMAKVEDTVLVNGATGFMKIQEGSAAN